MLKFELNNTCNVVELNGNLAIEDVHKKGNFLLMGLMHDHGVTSGYIVSLNGPAKALNISVVLIVTLRSYGHLFDVGSLVRRDASLGPDVLSNAAEIFDDFNISGIRSSSSYKRTHDSELPNTFISITTY